MSFNRHLLVLATLCLLPLWGMGCGGITASKSVSPATFLLPGLMRVTPTEPEPTPSGLLPAASQTLAQAQAQ